MTYPTPKNVRNCPTTLSRCAPRAKNIFRTISEDSSIGQLHTLTEAFCPDVPKNLQKLFYTIRAVPGAPGGATNCLANVEQFLRFSRQSLTPPLIPEIVQHFPSTCPCLMLKQFQRKNRSICDSGEVLSLIHI